MPADPEVALQACLDGSGQLAPVSGVPHTFLGPGVEGPCSRFLVSLQECLL